MVAILMAAPVVAAIASLLGRHWYPSSDQALEMLRISDVGGSHTPLLGAWSRWGWAHPGPLLFWVLAPFYRVFGETGVLTGTAALNLACMLAAVLIGYRRGGARLAVLVGLMAALLAHGTGDLLIDPWNPWAAFFPFVVFLLLVWSVLCGDLVMLPLAVAAGSFSVQAHAGYLPLVGGLLLLAVMWCLVPVVRDRRRESLRRSPKMRWVTIAAGVGVLVWMPALIDALSGGNNLRTLLAYARHPNDPSAGWDAAFGVMGAELRPYGAWVHGNDSDSRFGFTATSSVWPAVLTIAVLVAAAGLAWRRGHRDASRLALVALVATALAVVATSRVTGLFVPYVMHWWWGVAAIATLSIAWCLLSELRTAWARNAFTVIGLVCLVATVTVMLRDLPLPVPTEHLSQAIAVVGPPTAAALDPEQRYLVRGLDPMNLGGVKSALYFDLHRRGFEVFVDPDAASALTYGRWREATPSTVDAVVMIVDLPDLQAGVWRPPAGSRQLASFDPLNPAQRARVLELDATVRVALGDNAPSGRIELGLDHVGRMMAVGVPRAIIDEWRALEQLGDGYAVYLTPPPAA